MRYKIGNESELPEPKPDPSTIATFAPQEVRPLVGNLPTSLLVPQVIIPKNFAFFH